MGKQSAISQCAWCGAIRASDGRYIDLPAGQSLLATVTVTTVENRQTTYRVTHGVCPSCASALLADYRDYRPNRVLVLSGRF